MAGKGRFGRPPTKAIRSVDSIAPQEDADPSISSRRGDRMRRREVIAVLAAVTAGTPPFYPSRAQTVDVRRVGVVYPGGFFESSIEGLRDGLRVAGLEEGRHIALLIRDARGNVAAAEAAARALERDERST